MSTSPYESKEFAEHFFGDMLDGILEYINAYIDIEDAYSEESLSSWAKDNNFVEDIYDEDYLIDWAETNGYVKEEG